MRAAALLGLDERGGLYLVDLMGQFSVSSYLDMSPDSQFVAMSVMSRNTDAVMSICGRPNVLPFATGCMRGIAFDWDVSDSLLQSAVKTLAPGGRLVAQAYTVVPKGVEVIARDDGNWVAERLATPVLNVLRRAKSDDGRRTLNRIDGETTPER